MDADLRTGLWNVLYAFVLTKNVDQSFRGLTQGATLYPLFVGMWHEIFKKPIDTIPTYFDETSANFRQVFAGCSWHEAYDLIEFVAQNVPDALRTGFVRACNSVLEREMSAYRIIDVTIVEITSESELEAIESAVAASEPFSGAQAHLRQAIRLLSDRKSPDYRNSVKESICAIESIVKELTGNEKGTFGALLGKLEKSGSLHTALKSSFSSLYRYASDGKGIRHAMLEQESVSHAEAKLMLVTCSAFINYAVATIGASTVTRDANHSPERNRGS